MRLFFPLVHIFQVCGLQLSVHLLALWIYSANFIIKWWPGWQLSFPCPRLLWLLGCGFRCWFWCVYVSWWVNHFGRMGESTTQRSSSEPSSTRCIVIPIPENTNKRLTQLLWFFFIVVISSIQRQCYLLSNPFNVKVLWYYTCKQPCISNAKNLSHGIKETINRIKVSRRCITLNSPQFNPVQGYTTTQITKNSCWIEKHYILNYITWCNPTWVSP
jgi:hypothetical protein